MKLPNGLQQVWRISVEQYLSMVAAGILGANDPVELISGLMVSKTAKSPQHILSVKLGDEELRAVLPPGWFTLSEGAVVLQDSVPEPDVMVVRGAPRDYAKRLPSSRDIAIAVEVADSSLGRDRGLKRGLYAAARIPFYWVVNLVENRLEAYSDPVDGDYRIVREYAPA